MNKEIFQKMAKLEERLNWTVYPTDPVLPSYGELTKVSGVIERIYVDKQKHYFSPENYRTVEYETNRTQVLTRILSILSFLNGQFSMLANARKSSSLNIKTAAYFVNVQINGVVYRGWTGACPFEPDDEVELAVEWQDDHYELYAIARPKDKMISICPECAKGTKECIKELAIEVFSIFSILTLIFDCTLYYFHTQSYQTLLLGVFIAFFMTFCLFSLKIIFEFNTLFNTNVKLAEKIFRVLGFNDPQRINLQKTTRKRLKQIYKQTGIKPTKEDYEKKPMKDSLWRMLFDCYLYYYE